MKRLIPLTLLFALATGCGNEPISPATANRPPVAVTSGNVDYNLFSASPPPRLTSSYSFDSDGVIVAYQWTTDYDGEVVNTPDFAIDNLPTGITYVTLTVVDDRGETGTRTARVKFVGPKNGNWTSAAGCGFTVSREGALVHLGNVHFSTSYSCFPSIVRKASGSCIEGIGSGDPHYCAASNNSTINIDFNDPDEDGVIRSTAMYGLFRGCDGATTEYGTTLFAP